MNIFILKLRTGVLVPALGEAKKKAITSDEF